MLCVQTAHARAHTASAWWPLASGLPAPLPAGFFIGRCAVGSTPGQHTRSLVLFRGPHQSAPRTLPRVCVRHLTRLPSPWLVAQTIGTLSCTPARLRVDPRSQHIPR